MEIKGRGSPINPANRFERLQYQPEPHDHDDTFDTPVSPKTQFYTDSSRSILSENDSPDLGFRFSINAYRGCEHGCAYCYARPTHEYLGFSAGLDFETKIVVKKNAPDLLREKLMSKSWRPELIVVSGNTDAYQPAERHFRLTRGILEILAEFRNPAGIITKNHLITRDLDVLARMAEWNGVSCTISITSLDRDLIQALEPRTSRPESRLRAVEALARAGIPVNVNLAPIIPGLNDHEIPAILKAAAQAGARSAAMIPVRLPLTVLPVFTEWLDRHFPLRKNKVLAHIRDVRGGRLNDPRFNSRMRGSGAMMEQIRQLFQIHRKKIGLDSPLPPLSTEHFRRPTDQLSFF